MDLNRLSLASSLGASFDYQLNFIKSSSRFRAIVKARQIGMTTAIAIEKLLDALTHDNYVICIVSPSKRQSDRMMHYIKKAFIKLERDLKIKMPVAKWTNEEVYFHHGSEIHSLPNNPQAIQGYDVDDGVIDEAGLLAKNEGDEIMDALVGSLAAKQGRLTLSGRPRGKRGLLWTIFDPSEPRFNEFEHFKITWEDRAKYDKEYGEEVLKHKKILTRQQFEEIYEAQFIDEGVLVYTYEILDGATNLWKSKNFVMMPPEGTPAQDRPRYIGVDFGRKRNLTEIHVLQREEPKLLRTLMMKSMLNTNFEDQKDYLDALILRIHPHRMEIDEKGMGLPLLDYFQRKYGERFVTPLKLSNQINKEKVILQTRNILQDLQLAIPNDDILVNQLHSFQKEYTDAGNVKYSGKVDETDFLDDKVISLCAAVDAAQTNPFGFSVV